MSEEKKLLFAEIEKEVSENPVLIYIKGEKSMPMCGFSARVVEVFKHLEVPFETRNVLTNPAKFAALKEWAKWPTSPQLYLNGELVGGCDIIMELFQAGELQKMTQQFK